MATKVAVAISKEVAKVDATGVNVFPTGFNKNNGKSHYLKHAKDYQGITESEYILKAHSLIQKPVGGDILGYQTKDGKIVRYDKATNDFVSGDPSRGIATMMKLPDGERRFNYLKSRDGI